MILTELDEGLRANEGLEIPHAARGKSEALPRKFGFFRRGPEKSHALRGLSESAAGMAIPHAARAESRMPEGESIFVVECDDFGEGHLAGGF